MNISNESSVGMFSWSISTAYSSALQMTKCSWNLESTQVMEFALMPSWEQLAVPYLYHGGPTGPYTPTRAMIVRAGMNMHTCIMRLYYHVASRV